MFHPGNKDHTKERGGGGADPPERPNTKASTLAQGSSKGKRWMFSAQHGESTGREAALATFSLQLLSSETQGILFIF